MNTDVHGGPTLAGNAADGDRQRGSRFRIAAWSVAGLLLLLPLVAMLFTDEVNWTVSDFLFAGLLILSVGLPLELAVRVSSDGAYRVGAGLALVAAFLLVWVNGAVGIIGSEDNPANLMYGGVLVAGLAGSIVARFRPRGMARAMAVTALAQAAVAAIALAAGLGASEPPGPLGILALNGFFAALWAGSAALFREAARGGPEPEAD